MDFKVVQNMIEDLTDSNLGDRIATKKLLIVEFWDPWCGICEEMAPVYEGLAQKYDGKAAFARLNMRDNKGSPDKYEVYVTPTFIFFREGKEAARTGGLIEPDALEEEFKRHF